MKEIKAMNSAQATDFWTSMSRPDKRAYIKNHGMDAADAVQIQMDTEGNATITIPKSLTKKKPPKSRSIKKKKSKSIVEKLEDIENLKIGDK